MANISKLLKNWKESLEEMNNLYESLKKNVVSLEGKAVIKKFGEVIKIYEKMTPAFEIALDIELMKEKIAVLQTEIEKAECYVV